MGCIPLSGAFGVQWLKGDVYWDQRDSGESISCGKANSLHSCHHPIL